MAEPEVITPEQDYEAVSNALEYLFAKAKKYDGARAVIKKLNDEKAVLNQRIQELADEVTRLRNLVQSLEEDLELARESSDERDEYADRRID